MSKRSVIQNGFLLPSTRAAKKPKARTATGDEPPPPPGVFTHLDWRMDPEESLSDWKIQVVCDGEHGVESIIEYHVHKVCLAVGGRKCDYFERLFRGGRFSESKDSTSKIVLHRLAADVFPVFLDYLYDLHTEEPKINIETATALHYLGQYFGNHRLRWETQNFWVSDLTGSTVGTYYTHAKMLNDEAVLQAATSYCVNSYQEISPTMSIIKTSDPQLWLGVMESTKEPTGHLSILVARFCWEYVPLDTDAFSELTAEQNLPVIDCKAALEFLAAEARLFKSQQQAGSITAETNLQKRCLSSLRDSWHLIDLSDSCWENTLSQLHPTLLARLLQDSQKHSKSIYEEQKEKHRHNPRQGLSVRRRDRADNVAIARARRPHVLDSDNDSDISDIYDLFVGGFD